MSTSPDIRTASPGYGQLLAEVRRAELLERSAVRYARRTGHRTLLNAARQEEENVPSRLIPPWYPGAPPALCWLPGPTSVRRSRS